MIVTVTLEIEVPRGMDRSEVLDALEAALTDDFKFEADGRDLEVSVVGMAEGGAQ